MSKSLATPWICSAEDFKALLHAHPEWRTWALDTETDGLQVRGPSPPNSAKWVGLAPVTEPQPREVPILRMSEFEKVRPMVNALHLVGHNLRFDVHAAGLDPRHLWQDTLVAAYFGHMSGRKDMDFLAAQHGWPKIKTPDLIKQGRIGEVSDEDVAAYLADDVLITVLLFKKMRERVYVPDTQVERAVWHMEQRGVRLLEDRLAPIAWACANQESTLTEELRSCGFTGSLTAPQQIGAWLQANGRRLPLTKTGKPSTDAKTVLQPLAERGDPFVRALLAYRKLNKLRTAFIDKLPGHSRKGVIYPSVRTTKGGGEGGTATGRFAYADPNLQQIPARSDLGQQLRRCFTSPYPGSGVTVADYSQVELRMATVLSGEPVLLEAFHQGRDPHAETAAVMRGKPVDKITKEERFAAKAIVFGRLNGMGAPGVSRELGCSKPEGQRWLDEYCRATPVLSEWMEDQWRQMEQTQVAQTIAGRTRLFGGNEATRPGISVVVQGSAAEIMRQAAVDADEADMPVILVVHDEIVLGSRGYKDALQELMEESARKVLTRCGIPDKIPFAAEGDEGETWGDCK